MTRTMIRSICTLMLIASLMLACQTQRQASEPSESESASLGVSIKVLSDATVVAGAAAADRQRLLADLLYAALQALADDRLLTPVDDNAHARFMRVLAYDPDNAIALQGLQDIVVRYLQLSEAASHRGLFDQAHRLLDRARFVDDEHPDIAKTWLTLQTEMNSGDLFFDLDDRDFANRNAHAQQQLADIARQAKQHGAFFLITAPNDDLARWMFGVMREAVAGYRLRGNIELASQTSVRLRMPSD